jgi:hypothetical protein
MLIGKCYLKQFIKRHVHLERDREEPSQPVQTLPEITVILNGTLARGDTYNGKRKYRKYVFTTAHQQNLWYEPLTFTLENREKVTHLHEDALAISIVLTNHQVHRVLVDDESLVNILYKDEMSYTRIDPSKMTHVKKLFKWD